MDNMLHPHIDDFIIVYSQSREEHIKHVQKVFDLSKKY